MKDLYFLTKAASPFLPKRTMSFIADKLPISSFVSSSNGKHILAFSNNVGNSAKAP